MCNRVVPDFITAANVVHGNYRFFFSPPDNYVVTAAGGIDERFFSDLFINLLVVAKLPFVIDFFFLIKIA